MVITSKADMHKIIEEITGQKTFSLTECIKSKDGTLIIKKEKNSSKMERINWRHLQWRKKKT